MSKRLMEMGYKALREREQMHIRSPQDIKINNFIEWYKSWPDPIDLKIQKIQKSSFKDEFESAKRQINPPRNFKSNNYEVEINSILKTLGGRSNTNLTSRIKRGPR